MFFHSGIRKKEVEDHLQRRKTALINISRNGVWNIITRYIKILGSDGSQSVYFMHILMNSAIFTAAGVHA